MVPELNIQNCPSTQQASEIEAFFLYLGSTLELNSFLEFSLTFLSSVEICALNQEYRHQNSATDILSFCLEGVEGQKSMGDIYLCLEEFQDEFGLGSPRQLLFFLIAHGILHCLGWTHDDAESYQEMMDYQQELLQGFARTSTGDCQGSDL
jgi:probable rRNA maturation factor